MNSNNNYNNAPLLYHYNNEIQKQNNILPTILRKLEMKLEQDKEKVKKLENKKNLINKASDKIGKTKIEKIEKIEEIEEVRKEEPIQAMP